MDIKITIPTNWNELNDWQFKKISSMLHRQGVAFDLMVWFYLNQVKWYQFKKAWKIKKLLNEVPLSELKKHFSWVYSGVDRTIFPEHKKYPKPMDRLLNLTIEEFAIADDLNNQYLKTKDTKYLRLLAGVLYRYKHEKYNHLDLVDKYSSRFKHEHLNMLYAVHVAYNGCKSSIVKKYPNIYPKIKKQQKSNKKAGMLDVVLKMSGQKFGNYEQTKNTLVYTFLNELEESIIQQNEQKLKYENNR